MRTFKLEGKKGFSLMELLVILAVIAILASIAIPSFMDAGDQVSEKSDENTLEALNASLDSADALKTKLETVNDVRTYFANGGYSGDSLMPELEDHAYVWDQDLNAVLMVNLNDDSVLYPERFKDSVNDGTWYFIYEEPTAENNMCAYPCEAAAARAKFAEIVEDNQSDFDNITVLATIVKLSITYKDKVYSRPGVTAYAIFNPNDTYSDGITGPRLGTVSTVSAVTYKGYEHATDSDVYACTLSYKDEYGRSYEIISGYFELPTEYSVSGSADPVFVFKKLNSFSAGSESSGHSGSIAGTEG